ncbi:MAG: RdgB/HAM1 family non-canonical purine NTP pyrophosphatase [Candidatus Aminicenantes bacterium]|nr:RdgB/HAM1 family non-canonical purine NTP pyrophosphatase [Candidatus Aminicenantes bacterium]
MSPSPPPRKKLLAATTNAGKAREIARVLECLPFDILTLEVLEPIPPAPEEGRTFLENARQKAVFYSRRSPMLTLAEDSGLEIDHLDGAPGVFSARFSGPESNDARNIAKVLELLRGVPEQKRTARFVCCAILCRGGETLTETTGRAEGIISLEPRGGGGFGYDPIFFYPPLGRTFAELSPEEKNSVSHRGKALRMVRDFLRSHAVEA